MTYKLKDHVTDEMLVAVGFEITHFEQDAYRGNVFIPLINGRFKKRVITSKWLNMALKIDEFQDLIDLGYVEEMK